MATKILIIEDQSMFQNVYQSVLEHENWEYRSAFDGEEGIRIAKHYQPDLILLDLMLPKMNGLQFLQAFDAKSHPETKIIVLSNASTPEGVKVAKRLGASKYLIKATYFTPKQLLEAIREVLA